MHQSSCMEGGADTWAWGEKKLPMSGSVEKDMISKACRPCWSLWRKKCLILVVAEGKERRELLADLCSKPVNKTLNPVPPGEIWAWSGGKYYMGGKGRLHEPPV
jgi:hypothetical protein